MTLEDKIDILWEERAITHLILQFGRALDTGDWPAYRACFADPVVIDFGSLTGQPPVSADPDVWTRFAEVFQTQLLRHHSYSNIKIEIKGSQAQALTYHTSRHRRDTGNGVPHNTQYGWYEFDLTLVDGSWKMTRVLHHFQWVDGNQAVVENNDPEFQALFGEIFAPERQIDRASV